MIATTSRRSQTFKLKDPKRRTFSEYLTTNLPPSDRVKTEPIPPFIDKEFIAAIEDKIPKKITPFIARKVSRSIRNKTEQSASIDQHKMSIFNKTYNSLRRKSLSKIRDDQTHRQTLQQKWKKPVKRIYTFFNLEESLQYIEKKYESSFTNIRTGKYKQKIHPFCQIYDDQAEKVVGTWKKCIFNPFGQVPHIDY